MTYPAFKLPDAAPVKRTAICDPCREGRHAECAGVIAIRDVCPTPLGNEVREGEEPCACAARECAYDQGQWDDDRQASAEEDAGDAARDEEDDDIAY